MLIEYVDAIFVPVTDIEVALDWYQTYLGVKVNWRDKKRDWNAAGIGFKQGGIVLVEQEVTNKSDHIRFNIYSPDVSASYRSFRENAVEVNRLVHYENMDCFDFKDPSGNWIGIVGGWPEEGVSIGQFIGPDAIFLPVNDIERAIEWYQSLLGIDFEKGTDNDPQYPFTYGFHYVGDDRNHPRWFNLVETPNQYPLTHIPFNFQVRDIEKVQRLLKEKQISVTNILDAGAFRSFTAFDPDGNEIGFVEGGKNHARTVLESD